VRAAAACARRSIANISLTRLPARYYSDNDEDGLDMRKALPRDVHKVTRPLSIDAVSCVYLLRRAMLSLADATGCR
jgi:hypothetical protein